MADVFSKEKRSLIMSLINSKNTKPEVTLRKALHRRGYRFRIHVKALSGNPDIVFPMYRTVIQVRGFFPSAVPTPQVPFVHCLYWYFREFP